MGWCRWLICSQQSWSGTNGPVVRDPAPSTSHWPPASTLAARPNTSQPEPHPNRRNGVLHARVPGGQGPGLSRIAHCNKEQTSYKSYQGKQRAVIHFPGFAETPLRPCPRFSTGSDKAERDKSQIVLLCPTDWLHRA